MRYINPEDKKKHITSEILGIVLITLAVLCLVSLIGYQDTDNKSISWFTSSPDRTEIKNYAGIVGVYISSGLFFLFGVGAFLIPVILGVLGIKRFKKTDPAWARTNITGFLILSLALPSFFSILYTKEEVSEKTFPIAGLLGSNLSLILKEYFGIASYLIIASFILLGIILSFNLSILKFIRLFSNLLKRSYLYLKNKLIRRRAKKKLEKKIAESNHKLPVIKEEKAEKKVEVESIEEIKEKPSLVSSSYQLPPLSLLQDMEDRDSEETKEDLLSYAHALENTLANFGIEAKVVQVNKGPVVTRYELQPSSGTKVASIVSLSDDIALALAAYSVRIEAPIPGKQALGVEIPNKNRILVSIKDILSSKQYKKENSVLALALGKDISGEEVVADLGKMPHLLIAGTTGSGKSVCINCIIASLLYNAPPSELKLLLIDPKRVELSGFNGIPHLIVPVVTDPKRAAQVLSWLVAEMEERYKLLAHCGFRDIESFNQNPPKELPENIKVYSDPLNQNNKIPYIVMVIDELADLMMTSARDCEESITRIAQMARAVGIHLVIATQRPSVNVITGLIKANFPTRIAFQVSSKVDSRTILDMNGAEKLLGQGDMLYLPGGVPKPIRVQCSYISNKELESVVKFIKKQVPVSPAQIKVEYQMFESQGVGVYDNTDIDDEIYEKAVSIAMENEQISTSMIQRYLRIGYNRAARLIDMMEAEGIIGPANGSKPREVLIKNPAERI